MRYGLCWAAAVLVALLPLSARAQGALGLADQPKLGKNADGTEARDPEPMAEIYGFIMADAIFETGRIDPGWFDAMRPSKLPARDAQFGRDGNTTFSVRQTRFGVRSWFPAGDKQIKGVFEFDLFGVGADAGQTTFRLRHAYLEYEWFGAGQFHSPFMDIDMFPNSQDYWGPSGMAFFRNVQVRVMPVRDEHNHVAIAIERPGASADGGNYRDEVLEARDLQARFPFPDVSAEYRRSEDWGYVEVAGIVRRIEWDDFTDDQFDLSGGATGWGIHLSSNLNLGPGGSKVKGSILYGEGVENYMDDSTTDIIVIEDFSDPVSPLKGALIPVLGIVAFYDLDWNDNWTSSAGYSLLDLDYQGSAARADTFSRGHYVLGNVQYHPFPELMAGGELQWIRRENFSDGWVYDDVRVQVSFRYAWSFLIGGND